MLIVNSISQAKQAVIMDNVVTKALHSQSELHKAKLELDTTSLSKPTLHCPSTCLTVLRKYITY